MSADSGDDGPCLETGDGGASRETIERGRSPMRRPPTAPTKFTAPRQSQSTAHKLESSRKSRRAFFSDPQPSSRHVGKNHAPGHKPSTVFRFQNGSVICGQVMQGGTCLHPPTRGRPPRTSPGVAQSLPSPWVPSSPILLEPAAW
jgi:hypothetical protein